MIICGIQRNAQSDTNQPSKSLSFEGVFTRKRPELNCSTFKIPLRMKKIEHRREPDPIRRRQIVVGRI